MGRVGTRPRLAISCPFLGSACSWTPLECASSPWADEEALADTFPDLDELARECRFSDCQHEHEPDCAVLAAAEGDETVAARVTQWRALQRELAYLERRRDARLLSAERKRWAAIYKEARQRSRIEQPRR